MTPPATKTETSAVANIPQEGGFFSVGYGVGFRKVGQGSEDYLQGTLTKNNLGYWKNFGDHQLAGSVFYKQLSLGQVPSFDEGAITEQTWGLAFDYGYDFYSRMVSLHGNLGLGWSRYSLSQREYPIRTENTDFSRLEAKDNGPIPTHLEVGAGPCFIRDMICGLVTYSFSFNALKGTPINDYNQPSPVGAETTTLHPHGIGILASFDVGRAIMGMAYLSKIERQNRSASGKSGQ